MKKNVLFMGICLCCISSFIQAQEKEVFPVRDAEWTVCCDVSVFDGFYWDEYHVNDYKISLIGCDTVWNQENYHIFTECALYHIFTQRDLRGGFRTDGERVWITFDWKHEYLLYDFGVNVGDTVRHGAIYKEMPSYRMTSSVEGREEQPTISVVKEIKYESGNRNIYVDCFQWIPEYLSWHYIGTDNWQEGLGSRYGLFASWANMGDIPTGGYGLYGYITLMQVRNEQIVYFYPESRWHPEQPDIRSITEINKLGLQVYYDESLKSMYIHSENTDWKGMLTLYDLSGNRLSQFPVCGTAQIPFDSYPTGYYLYEIICEGRVIYSSKIRFR